MSEKAAYRTQQKKELLQYLESGTGTHVTVQEICAHFRARGQKIGTTTVYRQLEKMVDEGLVSKYIIDANTPACFEYVGAHAHEGDSVCFHCKCDRCGTLIHLHCNELAQLGAHLDAHHGFALNPMRTVFYGLCEDCRAKESPRGEER